MINKLFQNVKNLTWFLQSGVAPKNVPYRYRQKLEDINHMSSKKFAMTMVAISIIAFMYFASVGILFLFKGEPHVTALVNMYKDMIISVASIAATLVGIQGLVDWKHNSSSSAEISSEYIKEEIIENLTNNAKEEDYEITI
jgi:hypothetical protein